MIWQLDLILCIFVVICAVAAITVKDLLAAVIILGAYSFLRWGPLMWHLPRLRLVQELERSCLSRLSVKQKGGQKIESCCYNLNNFDWGTTYIWR